MPHVVIPIQTISFYNDLGTLSYEWADVVIPIQTISFYNDAANTSFAVTASCHTYPNDKLLQLSRPSNRDASDISCHTYPNDKLLQLSGVQGSWDSSGCHTYPNDKLLQLFTSLITPVSQNVVIPIQTISFYNCSRQHRSFPL